MLLQTCLRESTKLRTVRVSFDDCCWIHTRKAMKQGRAFLPLGDHPNIESLLLRRPCFRQIDDLVDMLNPNLKVLHLDDLTLGPDNMVPWSNAKCERLAQAVGSLTGLVSLSIQNCYFHDRHLESLLRDPSNLRCLSLSGMFGDMRLGSYLTDEAAGTIARLCPNLDSLDLSFQRQITSHGIEAVLVGWTSLKQFYAMDCIIRGDELATLLSKSSSLLYFAIWPTSSLNRLALNEAVIATNGRTLIYGHDVHEATGLSADQQRAQARSMQIREQAMERSGDPMVWNEWEGVT